MPGCLNCGGKPKLPDKKYCSVACYHRKRTVPMETRFWSYVDKSGECWLWTGLIRHGYGSIQIDRTGHIRAHRYSWSLANGPIPDVAWVLHSCDVRNCVNPAHLRLGTSDDNVADMVARKRNARAESHGCAKLNWQMVREMRRQYPHKSARELSAEYFRSRE